jgi:hypothetical protein
VDPRTLRLVLRLLLIAQVSTLFSILAMVILHFF